LNLILRSGAEHRISKDEASFFETPRFTRLLSMRGNFGQANE
jgi:hypothetical protein